MNQEIQFIGGAYTARSKDLNAQTCQNLYVEVDQTGGKNNVALVGVPGMKEWLDIGYSGEVRAMTVFEDNLYAVIKDRLYKIDAGKNATNLGTLSTSNGWIDFTSDTTYLGIFEEGAGWYTDGTTLTQILDANFPSPSGATYQDGYHIVSKTGLDQFYTCELDALGFADITTWSGNYKTVEGSPDPLVSPVSVQRQLWMIGEYTTEIYYNDSIDPYVPFTRNPGGFIRIGCIAKRSIATLEDDLLFLDNNNRVVRKNGLQLQVVSTYQIDYLINTFSSTSGAVGFLYSQEGHTFYELTFPPENVTICYDLTTGIWHTRASTVDNTRSLANCATRFGTQVLVGDYQNGKIYEYDYDTYTDDGYHKIAIRTGQYLNKDNNQIFVTSFELDMETGVGNSTYDTPQIALEVSKDGGHTWTPKKWTTEKWRNIGSIGQYGNRVKWYRLGYGRNWLFRVTIADDVKRSINRAMIDVVIGNG